MLALEIFLVLVTPSESSKCNELKSILANGAIPYSADMEFFAFELEILDMKTGAQMSFGVQDRSCELNKIIGTEDHSLGGLRNASLITKHDHNLVV